ncbi:MAG TPA: carboxypeptidase-like regulatory domain-containing protein [Gemmatimonadaceae bacterium]|nr:carboxypeptidase-like regulatory domain-containing protein [Gemmatimonadaceae bacterium]
MILAILVLPAVAIAQRTTGTTLIVDIADATNGTPLSDADVVLPELKRVGKADWLGEARISGIRPGIYRVRVRKFGYVPSEVSLVIRGDSTGAIFFLTTSPVSLDTVHVESESVPRHLKEFESRRRMGLGRFLTTPQLQAEGTRDFATVAAGHFPGLEVVTIDGERRLASTRGVCGADVSRALPHLGKGQTGSTTAGPSACFSGSPCLIRIYLDGIDLGDQDFDIVQTWDLAGVEYYSGSQMPVQFRTSGSACGVMLLWSRW